MAFEIPKMAMKLEDGRSFDSIGGKFMVVNTPFADKSNMLVLESHINAYAIILSEVESLVIDGVEFKRVK
jgi:hypothetical protein